MQPSVRPLPFWRPRRVSTGGQSWCRLYVIWLSDRVLSENPSFFGIFQIRHRSQHNSGIAWIVPGSPLDLFGLLADKRPEISDILQLIENRAVSHLSVA